MLETIKVIDHPKELSKLMVRCDLHLRYQDNQRSQRSEIQEFFNVKSLGCMVSLEIEKTSLIKSIF